MSRIAPTLRALLRDIDEIDPVEEHKFDEIPGWDGSTIEAATDKAVCLKIDGTDVWFPRSHLRAESRSGVLVASIWVLEQKGLL